MVDMIVRLYELRGKESLINRLKAEGIMIRRAMSYEKYDVVDWVEHTFGPAWSAECNVAFNSKPVSCHIATECQRIIGFACYGCTCQDFFGPIGVAETKRGRGIGKALILSSLEVMYAMGYAYAIIGDVDSPHFYAQAVGATEIPGSSPGIYRDRLRKVKGKGRHRRGPGFDRGTP